MLLVSSINKKKLLASFEELGNLSFIYEIFYEQGIQVLNKNLISLIFFYPFSSIFLPLSRSNCCSSFNFTGNFNFVLSFHLLVLLIEFDLATICLIAKGSHVPIPLLFDLFHLFSFSFGDNGFLIDLGIIHLFALCSSIHWYTKLWNHVCRLWIH